MSIAVHNITKTFGNFVALRAVSLTVATGESPLRKGHSRF